MWALIRRAVLFEYRLWRSLFRWIARRPVTGGVLHVSMSSQTNIGVVLRRPIEYRGRRASEVRLFADEPSDFVAAARKRVPVQLST